MSDWPRETEDHLPLDSVFPFQGIDLWGQSTMLDPRFSPDCRNITVTDGVLTKRKGLKQLGTDLPVGDAIIGMPEFEHIAGTKKLVCVTVKDCFWYDGGVWKRLGELLDAFDDKTNWTASGSVTFTDEGTVKKEGDYSMRAEVGDAFGTGIIGYRNFGSSQDVTGYGAIAFWFLSSVDLEAGDYEIVLAEDANGAKTGTYTTFAFPEILKDNWTLVHISGDFSDLDEVDSLGIYQTVDKDEHVVYIDDLKATHAWTGNEDDVLDYVVGDDDNGRFLFLTNGVDYPVYWNGSWGGFKKVPVSESLNLVTAKCVATFFGRLFFGNVTTSSHEPKMVLGSGPGNFEKWHLVDGGIDIQITSAVGDIWRLLTLGDRLMIYSEDSICALIYFGGSILFGFEAIVQETRLVGPRSVISVGPFHVYMSQENVIVFDGSRITRPIGDRIKSLYREIVSRANRPRAFAFHDAAKQRVYWFVPTEELVQTGFLLEYDVYDLARMTWVPFSYLKRATAMGFWSQDASLTWNSASLVGVSWDEMGGKWNDGDLNEGYPIVISARISGPGLPQVHQHVEHALTDAGDAIESSWDSVDFHVPEKYISRNGRWSLIELELRGVSVDVYTSVDLGETKQLQANLTLTSSWQKHQVWIDMVSETLRISLQNSASVSTFEVRWIRVWLTEGGR